MKKILPALGLSLFLGGLPATAEPTITGTYVVVRASSAGTKNAKGKCLIRGRVLLRGEDASRTRLAIMKGFVAESGRIIADDVPVAAPPVDASGAFTATVEEKAPWVVTTFVPGYEGGLVVLGSCGVEIEFHLEPLKK
ncbi:hypothetical protein HMI51_33435 [Corallococcus coralloides]|nr:hypothetical protein [Corallococcus coralloides]